jgi:Flp pilus assembly pilin Flp
MAKSSPAPAEALDGAVPAMACTLPQRPRNPIARLRRFLRASDGGVTVEFVMLVAAVIAMSATAFGLISGGTSGAVTTVSAVINP